MRKLRQFIKYNVTDKILHLYVRQAFDLIYAQKCRFHQFTPPQIQ